jgi:hypothetical protein
MKKYLEYKVPEISNSTVSVVMDLETVKVVSTESLGIIINAWVKPYTAMSNEGTLFAEIQNWGDLKSDYVVTVTDGNLNVAQPICPAQARVLGTFEEAVLEFDISTAYNLDTANEVLVSLKSPTGRVYDEIVVKFDTKKHSSKYSWDLRQKNEASQEGTSSVDPNDVTAPVITLNGADDAMVVVTGSVYVEPGATATDNVDGVEPAVVGGDVVNGNVAGIYVVTYDKTDSSGNAAKQVTRVVIVRGAHPNPEQDTIPPQLLLSATPTTLWPANGKMVEVTVTMIASDDVDPNPVVTLVGTTLSGGSQSEDVEVLSDGLIRLRAKNDASETNRTYKLTYRATDDNGNWAEESITITVPHDKSQL